MLAEVGRLSLDFVFSRLKNVATRLWGKVMPQKFFPLYIFIVMLSSHFVNEHFVKNKAVQRLAASMARFLASKTHGMLQDKGSCLKVESEQSPACMGVGLPASEAALFRASGSNLDGF